MQSDGIYSGSGRTVMPMTDARMNFFLADVLALEGLPRARFCLIDLLRVNHF